MALDKKTWSWCNEYRVPSLNCNAQIAQAHWGVAPMLSTLKRIVADSDGLDSYGSSVPQVLFRRPAGQGCRGGGSTLDCTLHACRAGSSKCCSSFGGQSQGENWQLSKVKGLVRGKNNRDAYIWYSVATPTPHTWYPGTPPGGVVVHSCYLLLVPWFPCWWWCGGS